MFFKIAPIIMVPRAGNAFGDVFIYQDNPEKELSAGKIFVIAEIETDNDQKQEIIDFVIQTVAQKYYRHEKVILEEKVTGIGAEKVFKAALTQANDEIKNFLEENKIKAKLSVIAGLINDDQLYFSAFGGGKALILAPKREKDGIKYRFFEILKQSKVPENPMNEQSFSDIVSGALPKNCSAIFLNDSLSEYLSREQLKKILSVLPPLGAAEQIKNELDSVLRAVPLLGLIIKNDPNSRQGESVFRQVADRNYSVSKNYDDRLKPSISELEKQTEKIMTPAEINGLNSYIGSAVKSVASIFYKKKRTVPSIKNKRAIISHKAMRLGRNIKNIISIVVLGLIALLSQAKKINWRKIKNIIPASIRRFKNTRDGFLALNKKQRTILIIAASIILLLVLSISFTYYRNHQTTQLASLRETISQIETNQNQVDANFLYNNEAGAKKLLEENTALLALLQNNKALKSDYNRLLARQNQQLEKVKHEVRIDNPKELANFANINQAKIQGLELNNQSNDKIYAYAENGAVLKYDTSAKAATAVSIENNPTIINKASSDKKNTNIYYLAENRVLAMDAKTDTTANYSISLSFPTASLAAMESYNQRLYFLDQAGGQIYRYRRSGSAYQLEKAWLNQTIAPNDAKDFAVEEYLYLLKNNGEVSKYLSGDQQNDFVLSAIEPKIQSATRLVITEGEAGQIFILEPAQKRIAVFDKKGNFLKQYSFPTLVDLKDFSVNTKDKKIYLLNSSSLFEAPL